MIGHPGIWAAIAAAVVFILALAATARFYHKTEQGRALVRTGLGGNRVEFAGLLAWPLIHRFEQVDIRGKRIDVRQAGRERLLTADRVPIDLHVAFIIRVDPQPEQVLAAARWLGAAGTHDGEQVAKAFEPRLREAVVETVKGQTFAQLYQRQADFKRAVLERIGADLNGYVIENMAVDHLAQPPTPANGAVGKDHVA